MEAKQYAFVIFRGLSIAGYNRICIKVSRQGMRKHEVCTTVMTLGFKLFDHSPSLFLNPSSNDPTHVYSVYTIYITDNRYFNSFSSMPVTSYYTSVAEQKQRIHVILTQLLSQLSSTSKISEVVNVLTYFTSYN